MKRAICILLVLCSIFTLCGCGNANKEVKQKLCNGVWVNSWNSNALGVNVYNAIILDFSEDGSFTYTKYFFMWDEIMDTYNGKYKIDYNKKEIELTIESDDEDAPSFEGEPLTYYINEYTHELILHPDESGKGLFYNTSSAENVYRR